MDKQGEMPDEPTQSTDDYGAYDAQADLALPAPDAQPTDQAFAPYAGELLPERDEAGYDVDRDIAR